MTPSNTGCGEGGKQLIKPFYINNKKSADSGRRHLCADCTDYADERIRCHKSNYEFMQLPGPHLHPEHPQIRGLI